MNNVCSKLEMVSAWEAPFMYRERIPEENKLFDDVNGCYPNDENWMTDVVLNLRASVDQNGRVNKISCYKVRDLSCGAGRPQTQDLRLSAADIKVFVDILNTYTVSRAEKVLPSLLSRAKQEGLPNEWAIEKINEKSIIFSKNGVTVSVAVNRILKALEISYAYLDVLYSADFWDANAKTLKPEDKEPLLSLFSLVDTSDYYNREQLWDEYSERVNLVESCRTYQQLLTAIANNDLELLEANIHMAKETPPAGFPSALSEAIQAGNAKVVSLLLANGANPRAALLEAMKQQNDKIVRLLLQCCEEAPHFNATVIAKQIGRPDYVVALLKKGSTLIADKKDLSFGVDFISQIAKYTTILWQEKHLEVIYKSPHRSKCNQMLASIAYCVANKLGDADSRQRMWGTFAMPSYEIATVNWVLEKNDIQLLKVLIKTGMKISVLGHRFSLCPDFTSMADRSLAYLKLLPELFADEKIYQDALRESLRILMLRKDVNAIEKFQKVFAVEITEEDRLWASQF